MTKVHLFCLENTCRLHRTFSGFQKLIPITILGVFILLSLQRTPAASLCTLGSYAEMIQENRENCSRNQPMRPPPPVTPLRCRVLWGLLFKGFMENASYEKTRQAVFLHQNKLLLVAFSKSSLKCSAVSSSLDFCCQ